MENELDVVRDVSLKLETAGIPYMLTGSMAMNYYAQPRMTRDIDLVLAASASDAAMIANVFGSDYYVSADAVRDSIEHASIFNLIHNNSVIKVDCIVRKNTDYRRLEFERRQRIAIGDFKIWIVSKEDLIISKLIWAKESHSEKQLRDVRNLVAGECDLAYIGHWTNELGLSNLWQECQT